MPRSAPTPEYLTAFVAAFLEVVELPSATIVGSSLGGLVALRLALTQPERVRALVLIDSAGLGRRINPVHAYLSLPGTGELAAAWGRTRLGARQRATMRAAVLFSDRRRAPGWWLAEQRRVARLPGVLGAVIATNRAVVGVTGQRVQLGSELGRLTMPALVMWGEDDRIVPVRHGRTAARRLPRARLVVLPGCGHLPHLERPDEVATAVGEFLADLD